MTASTDNDAFLENLKASNARAEAKERQSLLVKESIKLSPLKLHPPVKVEEDALCEVATLLNVDAIPISALDDRGSATMHRKHVVALNLYGLGRSADCQAILPVLSSFQSLRWLRLGSNRIAGDLPRVGFFETMRNLQVLRLDRNDITGSLPPQIGAMTSLRELNMSGNMMTGPLPEELRELGELHTLLMYSNQFDLPGALTNEAEGALHILKNAAATRKLMRMLFDEANAGGGSSLLASARASREKEEQDKRSVLASAASVIGYESQEVKKWFDIQIGFASRSKESRREEEEGGGETEKHYEQEPARSYNDGDLPSMSMF